MSDVPDNAVEGTGPLADPRVQAVLAQRDAVRAEEDAVRREFNIDDFLVTDDVQEIAVENLGIVRYKMLDTRDFLDLLRHRGDKDDLEMGVTLLHQMLSKADPAVTLEKLQRLQPAVTLKILDSLLPFLPTMLSNAGSTSVVTPKPSG